MKFDYTRIYRKFHDESPGHRADMVRYFSKLLLPHLPASREIRVLDVGCGMGFSLLTLKELGYTNISGVDSDEGQVAAARRLGLDVSRTDDTIGYLHDHRDTYDLVLCFDIIEHIPVLSQLAFTAAISRSLKTGGQLMGTVPNAYASLATVWRYNCWTHTSSFTDHSLDLLLYNGGFDDIQIHSADTRDTPKHPWLPVRGTRNWWLWRIMRLLRRLDLIAEFGRTTGGGIPLSLNLFFTAKKRDLA
jgi:SAM-dependent methyltransferase